MSKAQWLTLVVFDFAWFAAIVGGGEWLLAQWLLLLGNLALIGFQGCKQALLIAAAGLLLDGLFTHFGLFIFNRPFTVIPLFLLVLWLHFALMVSLLLSKLPKQFYKLAALMALMGAWGYIAAALLNAVQLQPSLPIAAIIIGVGWAFWLSPLIWLLCRRMQPPQEVA
ncbi:DUF2878 family protein [Ferrimonas senticii]|uniref:DUF2878 family protein n=1 Tax=Ferrimonas senticii TaxID=394566 RepID=UPI00041A8DB4|nr:DUF2878 family protein [Ferrimonas senticii]